MCHTRTVPARILIIRHGDDPPDDRAFTYCTLRGLEPVVVRPFAGDPVPVLDGSWAGSVVHGGPFNVFDEDVNPFLRDEHRWIAACLEREVPLLGICQGAQSIAWTLGAEVGPTEAGLHEFGYYEITPTEAGVAEGFMPGPLHLAQAHFHTFDVPAGATLLASSELYPHQAFRHGACAYGLQFHPEMTVETFRRWQNAPWAAYGKPGAQTREQQTELMLAHDAAQAQWFYGFLESLFGHLADEPPPAELGALRA